MRHRLLAFSGANVILQLGLPQPTEGEWWWVTKATSRDRPCAIRWSVWRYWEETSPDRGGIRCRFLSGAINYYW
jgi:hypothetical protein